MSNMNNKNRIEGIISANERGFGFVTTDDAEGFFVPPQLMRKVVPGDRVSAAIVPSPRKPGQFQAADLRIVERKPSVWQGTVRFERGVQLLVPDQPCFMPIEVQGLDFIPANCVISVRTAAIDIKAASLRTRLERVLGERTRPGFDADYALAQYDFPEHFDSRTLREAQALETTPTAAELRGRVDLRNVPLVTIDGESTKDFDDAVFGESLGDGGARILVAIADVTHYVKPGSALNKTAVERGTSVYLPGKTVPMLPENLSNGVCSLVPNEDRLAVVAELELDSQARVVKSKVYRAVMRSAARLTYNQVQAWMDGTGAFKDNVEKSLLTLQRIFEQLQDARSKRGKLEFEDKEAKYSVCADGEFKLSFEQRTDAHKLVEELMLLANSAVALRLREKGNGLFRHQAAPEQEDWVELKDWAVAHGLKLEGDEPSMLAMVDLIEQGDKSGQRLKTELAVRGVMQRAVYRQLVSSHYSLGYQAYTHFTSPIRRLSDLLVHRLLLDEELGDTQEVLAAQCSKRSTDSMFAERHVWDRLKKRLVTRDVEQGAGMKAHVVSSSNRGMRVVLQDWMCSALIESDVLQAYGLEFNSETRLWANGEIWEPGHELLVNWVKLVDDAEGHTELYAAPFAAIN